MGRVHIINIRMLFIVCIAILSLNIGCAQKVDTINHPVSFSHFSLHETGYEWKEMSYPSDNEVIIINSYNELLHYMADIGDCKATLPIDFSQYSLILARGVDTHGVRAEVIDWRYLPCNGYVMTVKISPNITSVITCWNIAIITPKIYDRSKVNLILCR